MRRRPLLLWALPVPALAQAEVETNTASRAELESLPGLGPALVQRLLAGRPYRDWPDLMHRVPGVKAATARKLSAAGLRVAGAAFQAAAPAPADSSAAGGKAG